MKGIILAGGRGTRLSPLTLITNKHLLPVYDRPMIFFPIETLRKSGILEIMVVCGKEHGGDFMNILGSGYEYGVSISYALQKEPLGIADALRYAETFAQGEQVAVILGDNIFEMDFSSEVASFKKEHGAQIFLKEVSDPERFGVPVMKQNKVVDVVEKPSTPPSPYAITGFYLYDPDVFSIIRALSPSPRGQLEVTDIHKAYLKKKRLSHVFVEGFWSDAGTFDSLHHTAEWAKHRTKNHGKA